MPATKLQEIIDAVLTLPPGDRQTLREFLSEPPGQFTKGLTTEMRVAEMDWLAKHEAEYAGQWVALDGDRLLGHGNDPKQLFAEARAMGVANPFVVPAVDPHQAQWGGWM